MKHLETIPIDFSRDQEYQAPLLHFVVLLSPKIIYFDIVKNLIHAMRDMNITDSLKASVFFIWVKISQVVAFGGLVEDQNISLATERWKINNRWKTPSAVRRIAKIFTAIETFFK